MVWWEDVCWEEVGSLFSALFFLSDSNKCFWLFALYLLSLLLIILKSCAYEKQLFCSVFEFVLCVKFSQ